MSDPWARDPSATLTAAVEAERLRQSAEFEELYLQQASRLEAKARERVRAEAERIASSEASAAGVTSWVALSAGQPAHPDVTALQGEILQESVLAEQLKASEEAREAQLRELQSSRRVAARPPKIGETPKSPTSQLREALKEAELGGGVSGEELRAEVTTEREKLRQLEQRAWRAQNAVRASEAHEDLLQAHRKDLERKLNDVQAQLTWMTPSPDGAPAGVAAEAEQLPSLERVEAGLSERLRQSGQEELAAQQVVKRLQSALQDLESDVGALWLDTSSMGNQEAVHVHAVLVAALPPLPGSTGGHPATLDGLLENLDKQFQATHEELQIDTARGSGWQAREEERLERIDREIAELKAEADESAEEASRFQVEVKKIPRATADLEDRLCEAADLRRENDVMRRQQSQWQKSQLRMLRLIEDMQRKRYRDVQSQATVAARLTELQRELPLQDITGPATGGNDRSSMLSYPSSRSPSPPKSRDMMFGSPGSMAGGSRLNAIWSDNVALKSRARRLEEEREDLIRSQEGLIKMAQSNLPSIQQARENMRLTHSFAEPHCQSRRAGY